MDASPTRTWLIEHRSDPQAQRFFEFAFGRRPKFELYDLKKDPHQIDNVAMQPEYIEVRNSLQKQLLQELRDTDDPRVVGTGETFDLPPFSGPITPK